MSGRGGFFFVSCAWCSFAFAAGATQGSNGTHASSAPMVSPGTSGAELEYFHLYKANGTYAIRFKSGLRASLDFNVGTVTLQDGVSRTTIPLADALLEANGGNVDAANQMFNQMYQDVRAAQSDAVMTYASVGTYGSYASPRPPSRGDDGFGGFGDPLWATPGPGGTCWPIPDYCPSGRAP